MSPTTQAASHDDVQSPEPLVPNLVSVTSQLMQNYKSATPFIAQAKIVNAYNPLTDQSELFTIGSDGTVWTIVPDTNSDTGWSSHTLPLASESFKYVAAGTTSFNSVVLYAVSAKDDLWYIMKEQGQWGQWQEVPWPSVSAALSAHNKSLHHITGISLNIQPIYDRPNNSWHSEPMPGLLCVIQDNESTGDGRLVVVNSMAFPETPSSPYPYQRGDNPWNLIDYYSMVKEGIPSSIQYFNGAGGDPGAYIIGDLKFPDNNATPFAGIEVRRFDTQFEPIGGLNPGNFHALTTANIYNGGNNYDLAFAVCDDDFTICRFYSIPSANHDGTIILTREKVADAIPTSQMAARSRANNHMDLFVLGTDQKLYHVFENDPGGDYQWSALTLLNEDLRFTQLSAGANRELFAEVFAVDTNNVIHHIWQAEEGSDWNFDEVDVNLADTPLQQISSYQLKVNVYGTNGVPLCMAPVTFYCKEAVIAEINGATCFIDYDRPWNATTNMVGEVTLTLPVKSLGVPSLFISTPFVPADSAIEIDPSGSIRSTLQTISANDLLNAKVTNDDGSQTNLLPDDVRKDASFLSNSVAASMQVADQVAAAATGAQHLQFFHRLNDHRVARMVSRSRLLSRIPSPGGSGSTQLWEIDFTQGDPVFRYLSNAELNELLASRKSLPSLIPAMEVDSDWGSVFDMIREGIAKLSSLISDGFNTVITVIIDGITYVFKAVVNTIRQVFDWVEQVFKNLGIVFEEMFRYLGYIFSWQDIRRSQQVIEHTYDVVLDFSRSLVNSISDYAKPGGPIDNFENSFSAKMDQLIKNLSQLNDRISDVQAINNQPPSGGEIQAYQCMNTNIVRDGLINAPPPQSNAFFSMASVLPEETMLQLQDLFNTIRQQGTAFQGSSSYTNAENFFMDAANKKQDLMLFAAVELLKIAKAIVVFACESAKVIIPVLCKAFISIIDQLQASGDAALPSVIFVSDLYKRITTDANHPDGEVLTSKKLMALLAAVPATALYKVISGKSPFPANNPQAAPFPDQQSVDAFRQQFTLQWLQQSSGIGVTGTRAAFSPIGDAAKSFFMTLHMANSFAYIPLDATMDIGAQSTQAWWKANEGMVNNLAYAHSWLDFIFSVPWVVDEGGAPGCDTKAEFTKTVWLVQIAGLAIDGGFMWAGSRTSRGSGPWGTIVTSLFGAVNQGLSINVAVLDKGENKWQSAVTVMGAIPGWLKWITLIPRKNNPWGAFANGALIVMDVVFDGMVAINELVELIELVHNGGTTRMAAQQTPKAELDIA